MSSDTKIQYHLLNDSELIELCVQNSIYGTHRGLKRETLVELLTGRLDKDEFPRDPLDEEREVMIYMQETFPRQIFGQLKCANEGYACHQCPPGRVTSCVVVGFEANLKEHMRLDMQKSTGGKWMDRQKKLKKLKKS